MTGPLVPGAPAGSDSHDVRAWVARRRRLLDQVDEALRQARAGGLEDDGEPVVATILERVRSELRRDVSVVDVDAATEPHLHVVGTPDETLPQRSPGTAGSELVERVSQNR